MARFSTPGVYVKENNAFSSSVVSVPTAIPAFIGYTEKADKAGGSLLFKPTRVDSLKEYISFFGRGAKPTFALKAKDGDFDLIPDKKTQFNLYNSLRLFYANGGGVCYIVSVGSYKSGGVKEAALKEGLESLMTEQEPSMVVAPDATLLPEAECYTFYQQVLKHCGKDTKDRFAILDIHGGDKSRTFDENDVITKFRTAIGTNSLNYGAAYYPYLNTNIVGPDEVSFRNISNPEVLITYLTKSAQTKYLGKSYTGASSSKAPVGKKGGPASASAKDKGVAAKASSAATATATMVAPAVEERVMRRFEEVKNEISRVRNANGSSAVVDQNLRVISPNYTQILNRMRELVKSSTNCRNHGWYLCHG